MLLLAALLIGLLVFAKVSGVSETLSLERIRELTESAGAWGGVAFVTVFCLGELVHVPGLVFVAAGVAGWGWLGGGLLSYLAGLVSVSFTFAIVRGVGGQPLGEIKQPWVKKTLAKLETHPITTIAVLRTVLLMSPPLNYALALSKVRFREYLLGSALGLVVPIGLAVALFEFALLEL
jgi:uncharacterized membrane protein YdjX (TVP38/TMEM64 family)